MSRAMSSRRVGLTALAFVAFLTAAVAGASRVGSAAPQSQELPADWSLIGPDETIVSVAASPTFEQDHTIFAGAARRILKSTDSGSTWTELGSGDALKSRFPNPAPSAERNWVVRISPAYATDRTVLAAASDGAFLSADAGNTWTELLQGVPICPTCPRFVHAAFSPSYPRDHSFILVSGNGGGLVSSADGGSTFKSANTGMRPGSWVLGLAFSPNFDADRTIWSGWQGGVLKSSDAGASWQAAPVADDVVQNDVGSGFAYLPAISPDGSTLMLGAQKGVLRSTDGGDTWERLERGPCLAGTGTAFHPNFATNGVVYSVAPGCDIYRSDDRGDTWTAMLGITTGNSVFPAPLISSVEAAWLPGEHFTLLVPSRHGLLAHVDDVD